MASGPNFFTRSFTRAFRLRIDPSEVLDSERVTLSQCNPPITSPTVQAFLAWRRSLLFVIAVLLVPMVIFGIVELAQSSPDSADGAQQGVDLSDLLALQVLQFLVLCGFTVTAWVLLRQWANWHRQRRILAIAWAAYFVAPFLLFLYPFRAIVPEGAQGASLLYGIVGSVLGFMSLAPKAISLMPGILRASVVAKLLFPGSAAPGWLMVFTAPIYGLLIYVVLLTPYQITGNGLFIVAMIGLIAAQVWLGRSGYRLTRPMHPEEAMTYVSRARTGYLVANALGLLFIVIGFADLVGELDLSAIGVVELAVSLVVNVLLLTLVATDVVLLGLERARGAAGDPRTAELRNSHDQALASFMASAGSAAGFHPPAPQAPMPQHPQGPPAPMAQPPRGPGAPPTGAPPPGAGGPPTGQP